jgi:hypothetical protein
MQESALYERRISASVPKKCGKSDAKRKVDPNAFLIDNLKAQSTGPDLFLSDNPEHSVILHVCCFAHLLNLGVDTRTDGRTLSRIIDMVGDLQLFLRKCDAISFIGKKCPALASTRWLYLVDIVEFLLERRALRNVNLLIQYQ